MSEIEYIYKPHNATGTNKHIIQMTSNQIINELAKQGNVSKEELSKMPVDRLVIMLNKNIFISPEENIVILCTENEPTKDEIMAVTKNSDGKYELEDIESGDKVIADITRGNIAENLKSVEALNRKICKERIKDQIKEKIPELPLDGNIPREVL